MLKEEFPPAQDRFKNFDVRLDLGYLGFAKGYKCRQAYLPTKAYKKRPLTDEQKLTNRELSRQRIGIKPHRRTDSIGRMKRYRILSDRLRMHDFVTYNDVLEICAGLWNFYLTN